MLKLFQKKPQAVIGIDISACSVKVLQILPVKGNYSLEGYAQEDLPDGAVEGTVIKDILAVSKGIKQAIFNAGVDGKNVVVAVPDSAVINKIVQVNQGLNDSEIEELIFLEADKYIPYPINEVNLDFQVIGPSTKNSAMLDVLVVASRAENVNARVEAVTRAGFSVSVVDIESLALERTIPFLAEKMPRAGENKIIAIIDLGAVYTHLFVSQGMKIMFTREEEFGGLQLVGDIARHYAISRQEAMKVLKEGGTQYPDYHDTVFMPFIESIFIQIKRTLQFFYSTSHYSSVDQIFLAGGLAKLPGLADLLEKKMGIPAQVANPVASMQSNPRINQVQLISDIPGFLIACGLALRHVK